MKKILVVVDFQKDFVDGSLGFPGAAALADRIAEKSGSIVPAAVKSFSPLIRTKKITEKRRRAAFSLFPTVSAILPGGNFTEKSRRFV